MVGDQKLEGLRNLVCIPQIRGEGSVAVMRHAFNFNLLLASTSMLFKQLNEARISNDTIDDPREVLN